MSARRFLAGCTVAAAAITATVLAVTAWTIHETGRAHRHAKGHR